MFVIRAFMPLFFIQLPRNIQLFYVFTLPGSLIFDRAS